MLIVQEIKQTSSRHALCKKKKTDVKATTSNELPKTYIYFKGANNNTTSIREEKYNFPRQGYGISTVASSHFKSWYQILLEV